MDLSQSQGRLVVFKYRTTAAQVQDKETK